MTRAGLPALKAALVCAAFLFGAAGCASFFSIDDLPRTVSLAMERGFSKGSIEAGPFRLATFMRKPLTAGETLVVYIEGDGAAWPTPYHPPRDPSPRRPVSLSLAVADPAPAIVYLGRPCQYLDADSLRQCDSVYWVERRFSPEVVNAYDEALNVLKSTYSVSRLGLVGYSGGGVIAALLAARRDDVESLITVAAPLAVSEWVAWHGASELAGSLDPAELNAENRLLFGVHFVGGRDKNVPVQIVEKFVSLKGGRMEIVPDFDHDCCWARDWEQLLGLGRLQVQGSTN